MNVGGTGCVTSCPGGNYINYARIKCVANCVANDGGNLLSSDSTKCYKDCWEDE